jgi:cyclophilin family peptidyl-prolyl cis-trans isomerase/HEAT repeat protein
MFLLVFLLVHAEAADTSALNEAIWQAERTRMAPSVFAEWTAHPDETPRIRATRALGRLNHASALVPLTALLKDPSPGVRAEAAFALGFTPGGTDPLMEATEETDPLVMARIFDALGHQGDSESVPWLLEGLTETAPVARAAAVALGRIGMAKKEAVDHRQIIDELVYALGIGQIDRRRGAAFALARIGPTAWSEDALARVQHLAQYDFDPLLRSRLVRALLAEGEGQEIVPVMKSASTDIHSAVRIAATRGLQKLPPDRALKTGTQLLEDPEWAVRLATAEALVELEDRRLNPLLLALKDSPDPALQRIGGARHAVVYGMDHDRDWPVNVFAGWLSKVEYTVESDGAHNRPYVYFATRSDEQLIRTVAAGRLIQNEAGPEWGAQLLKAEDPVIQAVGISLLGKRPSRKHLEDMAALLKPQADHDIWTAAFDLLNEALDERPRLRLPKGLLTALKSAITRPHLARRLGQLLDRLGEPPPPPLGLGPALPSLVEIERIQVARIMTDAGELRVRLRPDLAPGTVWNFAQLAEADYFDGFLFHRVVPDFVIQDGCPRGDGWGGPGWSIPDELSWLPYEAGTLGMALSGPDTGGSQWFITLSDQPHLEGKYTVFGKLTADSRVAHAVRLGTVIQDVIIERLIPTASREEGGPTPTE